MTLRALAVLVAAALVAGAAACGRAPSPATAGADGPARLYAASSVGDVLTTLTGRFEPDGGRVVASYGASNALAQQVREGAPPGVFVSASVEWADRLEEWGLVEPGSRVELAGNSLVVIVPRIADGRPAALGSLADLAETRFGRIALADPEAVPAGRYASAAVAKAGVLESLRDRIVAAQDVRTALAYVERGEVPAGIVYATDAAASSRVDVAFRVPSGLHPRIVYPMVLVKGAPASARALHAFLRSDTAWPDFERAGFVRP